MWKSGRSSSPKSFFGRVAPAPALGFSSRVAPGGIIKGKVQNHAGQIAMGRSKVRGRWGERPKTPSNRSETRMIWKQSVVSQFTETPYPLRRAQRLATIQGCPETAAGRVRHSQGGFARLAAETGAAEVIRRRNTATYS